MRVRAGTTGFSASSPSSSPSSSGAAALAAIGACPDSPSLPSRSLEERVEEVAASGANGLGVCLGCEPSADGVLTAIGLAYLARAPQDLVRVVRSDRAQPRLDEVYVPVETDSELAARVFRGFGRTMRDGCPKARGSHCAYGCGAQCVRKVLLIAASDEEDMPETLHAYVVAGFAFGRAVATLNSLPGVSRAEELATSVVNECEKARQFIRFSRLADGTFHAAFRPKADVIPLVAGHFSKRMATERFAIVDPSHDLAVLGADGKLLRVSLDHEEAVRLSIPGTLAADEPYVRALWKRFYDALALPDRGPLQRGYDLRMSFMPKRLWDGLIELDPAVDDAWTYIPPAYQGKESQERTIPKTRGGDSYGGGRLPKPEAPGAAERPPTSTRPSNP